MGKLCEMVAVVTGASRGLGRGVAVALGEAGATVYVTGRSTREGEARGGRSETIDETAEAVTVRGGTGIAVRCDHTVDAEVEALFARVEAEQGRIDLLVNNAWSGYEVATDPVARTPFWEAPLEHWDLMFVGGLRAQIISARFAVSSMCSRRQGLIINTVAAIGPKYQGYLFYDVVKTAAMRMTMGMAEDLRAHEVAVVALAPGWIRTERILDAFEVDSDTWRTIPFLENSESPDYAGRAVVALASDPNVMNKSGQCFEVGHLAREYDFTDVDGRQVPPYSEQYPELFGGE